MIGLIGLPAPALAEMELDLEDVNALPTTAKDQILKLSHATWDHARPGLNGVSGRLALLAADPDNVRELVSAISEPTDVKEKTTNLSNAVLDHVQNGLNGKTGDNALLPVDKELPSVNVPASEESLEIISAQDQKLNNAPVTEDHALSGLHGKNGLPALLHAEVDPREDNVSANTELIAKDQMRRLNSVMDHHVLNGLSGVSGLDALPSADQVKEPELVDAWDRMDKRLLLAKDQALKLLFVKDNPAATGLNGAIGLCVIRNAVEDSLSVLVLA